jgi:glycosyltransferase involved in cell wall biosynthesis
VADPVFSDLVTVVIPACNAAATLDETLHSVRAQTYRHLEIIVVDDGSRDATAVIAERHAAEDPRVRLIIQANAGVAAARNRGIAAATGELIAPIDADDLWRPQKIEQQVAALRAGGPAVALVYTWSARIDANSRILDQSPGARHAGTVTYQICRSNFIGNGSAVLMRKSAVEEAGQYDPSLRARSAEGVEDWLLYFRIATRHQFAVVPDHLTGYRFLPTSMSANIGKMLKGHDIVAAEMCEKFPRWAPDIESGRLYYLTDYQFANALRTKRPRYVLMAIAHVLRESAARGAKKVAVITVRLVIRFALHRLPYLKMRDGKGLSNRPIF